MEESEVLGPGARCSHAEGAGQIGVLPGRQFAVIGKAVSLPGAFGRVLLFSAKSLLEYRHLRRRCARHTCVLCRPCRLSLTPMYRSRGIARAAGMALGFDVVEAGRE